MLVMFVFFATISCKKDDSSSPITPQILWNKTLGGTFSDTFTSIIKTADGGFITAGHLSGEGWIVKFDAHGDTLWSKLYGGTSSDYLNFITATPDGGFVCTGISNSNNGDASGNHGDYDCWIIKLDSNGDKQWSKLYGGSGYDYINSIVTTADGGFAVAGYSNSTNGDVSGNHGLWDGWVMKVDVNGNKKWSKLYGGSVSNRINSIVATVDGGFAVAGYSNSNDGDFKGNHGADDGWIAKLDANGNVKWSKLYGGSGSDDIISIVTTVDGGFAVAGFSYSNDGDLKVNLGHEDGWVMKVDVNGNKLWSKSYGGADRDGLRSIMETSDGGYIGGGFSISNDGDLNGNNGQVDGWVIRLASNGNKRWSKLFGGTKEDGINCITTTNDGGFAVAGYSVSIYDDSDGWAFKFTAK